MIPRCARRRRPGATSRTAASPSRTAAAPSPPAAEPSPPAASPWQETACYVQAPASVLVGREARVLLPNPPESPRTMLTIGEWSQVFGTFCFQLPGASIVVGRRCQLGASLFIATDALTIGDDVLVSWGCTVMDADNHSPLWTERRNDVANYRKDYDIHAGKRIGLSHDWSAVGISPIVIESKVWLGFNVIVLKGVTIGEGSVIGAGSVVTGDIPPWSIAAGNPCRVIREVPRHGRGQGRE